MTTELLTNLAGRMRGQLLRPDDAAGEAIDLHL